MEQIQVGRYVFQPPIGTPPGATVFNCRLHYDRRLLSVWDCYVNNWQASYYGGQVIRYPDEPLLVPPDPYLATMDELTTIRVEQFPDDDSTMALTDQLLHAMPTLQRPIAFELVGSGDPPVIATQYTCHTDDHAILDRQLSIHFPNAAVVVNPATCPLGVSCPLQETAEGVGAILALDEPYCYPLRTYQDVRPADLITVAVAAMERLERHEWAAVQVLWEPTLQPWQQHLMDAIANPYKPNEYFVAVEPEQVRGIKEKFASPLFAVSIRLLASSYDVLRHLIGWSEQFANPPLQGFCLKPMGADDDAAAEKERAWMDYIIAHRCTHIPGLLLNAKELACLVHLPTATIPSERLKVVATRTRPTVAAGDEYGSVALGDNIHRGKTTRAVIPAKLRPRHCYVAGASGTGKSTLLLNMICQDINAGHGVGCLDPHGDLINAILPRIPEDRVDDVVLFDPTDREHPFALNILSAKDGEERERIVDETIMSLQRYFPASWGPRLERILTFAIKGVLDADPASTLADVERILVDDEFRLGMAERMSSERYQRFWIDEFPKFRSSANDPVLNKLSVFVEKRIVRNIVCQRHCSVDFDEVLNNGQIFLANLSTGILNESVANILGSFLVTKIVNAAFRRAGLPPERRVPWYLYIDEFQNFMGVSVGFERILAEARKYNLCLAGLANQYIGQLSPSVRQAIFGNIGVMITFRLGVEDATIAAREMGVFTADEILNLELGEAIARTGGSKTAYNLQTYPEPPLAESNPTRAIKARMHAEFAKPRRVVEREFTDRELESAVDVATEQVGRTEMKKSGRRTHLAGKARHDDTDRWPPGKSAKENKPVDPSDPNEDDFVT